MDTIAMKSKKDEHYANTHFQLLTEHLFAVGYIAQQLFYLAVDNDDYQKLSQIAFLAGCLHDIGKVDPLFQQWVKKGKRKDINEDGQHIDTKFTFEKHPRHNEIALWLFCAWKDQFPFLTTRQKDQLEHLIYWHHAKPYRKNDKFKIIDEVYEALKKNLNDEALVKRTLNNAIKLVRETAELAKNYMAPKTLLNDVCDHIKDIIELPPASLLFPYFKKYSEDINKLNQQITEKAANNVLRACVISADRLVSSLSASELTVYIQQQRLHQIIDKLQNNRSLLPQQLITASKKFPDSERTQLQNQKSQQLVDIRDVAVLAGPAGCGKTRIALEWAKLKQAKKIIWVCPRVQVCQGIFSELTETYLPDTKIEIFTGEFKYTNNWQTPTEAYFSGDIIVTTIDQIVNSITTHTKVDTLLPFMSAHIIFDEYHEYVTMEIFNILFAELVAAKNMRANWHKDILLVSATPHYLFLKEVLNIDNVDVIEMDSFNQSDYQINFIEYDENDFATNPFFQSYTNNTFLISNTATTAQLGFILHQKTENSILFHSKFKRNDKRDWFNKVYTSFCENGTKQYQVLRSGPIVQASLNISCDQMLTEMSNAENILQRLGRLDRFGKNISSNLLTIAITASVKEGKSEDSSASFLNRLHCLQASKAWYDFLKSHLSDKTFQLTQLYKLYKSFYIEEQYRQPLKQDLNKALTNSIELLDEKVTEPVTIASKISNKHPCISKHSLRGDSRFVQLALLDIENYHQPIFMNQYAYQIPVNDTEKFDNLTESLSYIEALGLLKFMSQKHGNIDANHPVKGIPDKKQKGRLAIIKNYARKAEYPIYLSYIEDDLNQVGGVDVRHSQAIYYAICKKQPIGSIAYEKIQLLNSQNKPL
jgi:CRISPR-associated endonuclease/helicase Cas3